jgi:hypothetical protein
LTTRKLPARYARVVAPFLLTAMMTCLVSLIATVRGVGLSAQVLAIWPGSWLLSWVIAFPITLVVLPLVGRLTALIVEPAPPPVSRRP